MGLGQVGRFELLEPLGRGAVGAVWRARGLSEGELEVAVKVMDPDQRQLRSRERAFLAEARAIAALDHPGVVAVHEFGLLTEAEAEELGLAPDSPWLAMELLPGGTLEARPPSSWHALYRVLLDLLGALAHAHARGVVHRDLKAENILYDATGAIRLVDFGMVLDRAQALAERPLAGGTPAYMAPEQFSLDWRQQGPWTDLYAVGVLGWWGATGAWPLLGSSVADWKRVHASASVPAFRPRWPCPPGFEAWLRRLLEKRVQQRPRDAALCRHALRQLAGDIVAERRGLAFSERAALAAPTLDAVEVDLLHSVTAIPDETLRSVRDGWVPPAHTVKAGPDLEDPGFVHPPVPGDWRTVSPGAAVVSGPTSGAAPGIGIFPFRQPTLVGREPEQDRLWSALRGVHADGQPRGVLLRGSAGMGKSALGDWIWHTSVELGLVFPAINEDDAGRRGVDALLRRLWRAEGLEDQGLLAWLYRALAEERAAAPDTPEAVAELLGAGADPSAQVALALRAVGRRRGEHPLLLWLDDLHLDAGSRILARRVLDGEVPALVVGAWRDEDVDPAVVPELRALSEHPRTETLFLGPLGEELGARLLSTMLAVRPALARRLAVRSQGNPLFTVEVARDWVRRGLLEEGPEGYELSEAAPPLPRSLAEVWRLRLSPLLHRRQDRVAFELAALLDEPVRPEVFSAACVAMGVPEPVEAWRALLREGLVRPLADGSWRFSHAMLRESLARGCRSSGRWGSAHAACARAWEGHTGAALGSVARHLAAAGDHAEALALLPQATDAAIYRGDRALALALCEATEQCLRGLGRTRDTDEDWLRCRLRRARVARIAEETELARAEAEAVRAAADALDHEALVLNASRVVVQSDIDLGRFEEAAALSGRLAARSPLLLGLRAMALGRLGRLDVAEAIAEELVPHTEFFALFLRGVVALERGEAALARERLGEAIAKAEQADSVLNAASFRTHLSTALRLEGRLQSARRVARQATEELERVGSPWVVGARVQAGLAALALGELDSARRELDRACRETRDRPDDPSRHLALAALARLGAQTGQHGLIEESLAAPLPRVPLTRSHARDAQELWSTTEAELRVVQAAALLPRVSARVEALRTG